MKIAVVSSIFIPDLGYLEEGITKVLTGMGHEVTVFASFHYPFNTDQRQRIHLKQNQTVVIDNRDIYYQIIRLQTIIKIRSNIICYGLKRNLQILNPDLVILIGVSDFFPINIINKKFCTFYKTYAFIGQNYDMFHWRKTNSVYKKIYSYVLNNLVKGLLYRRSVRYLSKILFYTPDSEEIISKFLTPYLNKKLQLKKTIISLGYDANDFYFSHISRDQIRKQLNIPSGKVVVITATRIEKSKRIIEIINEIFLINRLDIVYIVIGFIENKYKTEIEDLIQLNDLHEKVVCMPFMSNESLANYFSASDFGIWLQSGASIQQAMGTGLPILLNRNSTTSFLLQEGFNGYYIDENLHITLSTALSSYSFNLEKRKKIEQHNKNIYSYQSLLQKIIG